MSPPPDEGCVTLAQCFQQHASLRDALRDEYEEKISGMIARQAQVDMRLQNGQKAFGALEERLRMLEPKKPDVFKIVGIVLTLVTAVVGGLWFLAASLGDRPTEMEVDAKLHQVSASVHKVDDKVEKVQEKVVEFQVEQRVMQRDVKTILNKLDEPRRRTR